jgi:large subunit ribosomal protein L28
MARTCKITGKKPLAGHRISKSHRKTKRWQKPNLQKKRIYDSELGREIRLRLSTKALRSISRAGLGSYLNKRGLAMKDVQ